MKKNVTTSGTSNKLNFQIQPPANPPPSFNESVSTLNNNLDLTPKLNKILENLLSKPEQGSSADEETRDAPNLNEVKSRDSPNANEVVILPGKNEGKSRPSGDGKTRDQSEIVGGGGDCRVLSSSNEESSGVVDGAELGLGGKEVDEVTVVDEKVGRSVDVSLEKGEFCFF